MEAVRFALSAEDDKCGNHSDSNNDTHPHFSPVLVISCLVEINGKVYPLAIIAYSRRSIWEYCLRRASCEGDFLRELKAWYTQLPPRQREISKEVLRKPTKPFKPHHAQVEKQYGYFQTACHMNVLHFLSPYIDMTIKLQQHFGWDFARYWALSHW